MSRARPVKASQGFHVGAAVRIVWVFRFARLHAGRVIPSKISVTTMLPFGLSFIPNTSWTFLYLWGMALLGFYGNANCRDTLVRSFLTRGRIGRGRVSYTSSMRGNAGGFKLCPPGCGRASLDTIPNHHTPNPQHMAPEAIVAFDAFSAASARGVSLQTSSGGLVDEPRPVKCGKGSGKIMFMPRSA